MYFHQSDNPLTIFRAHSVSQHIPKRPRLWQAIRSCASFGGIRGKSAFPAFEGRLSLDTFLSCCKKVSRRRQKKDKFFQGGLIGGVLLAFFIFFTAPTFADEFDHARMRRDLDIAEEALKRVLQYREKSDSEFSWNEADQVQGIYVDGYGVVFMVKTAPHLLKVGDKIRVKKKDVKDEIVSVNSVSSDREDKPRIVEFLRTYGPTIGQLQDTDRIAVVVEEGSSMDKRNHAKGFKFQIKDDRMVVDEEEAVPDVKRYSTRKNQRRDIEVQVQKGMADSAESVRVRFVNPDSSADVADGMRIRADVMRGHSDMPLMRVYSDAKKKDRLISQAAVLKKDVEAFRRGDLNDEAFDGRVVYQTMSADTLVVKKIDIMAGILDTALGKRDRFLAQDQTTGAYIPNLGAIFFVRLGNAMVWVEKGDKNNSDVVQNTMIETVADYGPTLRDLNADDDVMVQVSFDRSNRMFQIALPAPPPGEENHQPSVDFIKKLNDPPDMPGHLTLRVQKKYLDDYASGKVSLDELKQKMMITKM
jgi:hypothetical protein